jgi:PAS domain S-box-containing protein
MTAGPDTAVLDRLLLEGSSEILLLIDGDSLAILAANAEARRHMGDGLIGQAIGEYECALADMFFWDEMRGHGDSLISAESALRCADGQVLDVAKTVRRVSITPLIYSVCATPVASHNRIESELANMGSRLRATLEATADGILLVDQEGAIINMNQRFSAMWQLPESLLVNRDDAGIFRHLDAQRKGEAETAETDEAGVQVQYLNDGRVFECSVHSAHAGEEVIGCVYSYRDVTERYRTQRELISARDEAKRASAAKGEFLAMMSHEIRTPMNGVLGIAELLAGTKLDDEQTDFVRVIRSSGETLLGIINDILDYSKIEGGQAEPGADRVFPAAAARRSHGAVPLPSARGRPHLSLHRRWRGTARAAR